MARKKGVICNTDPTRNYAYAAWEPTDEAERARFWQQVRLMHCYRNALVALELDRRQRFHALHAQHCPDVEMLAAWESELDTAVGLLAKNAKQANRSATAGTIRQTLRGKKVTPTIDRSPDALGLKQALVQQREMLALVRAQLRQARELARQDPVLRQSLVELQADHELRKRALRGSSQLWWGNYLVIEQAAAAFGRGTPPRFRSFRGGQGTVAVQLQGGLSVATAFGCTDTRLRIERVERPAAPVKAPVPQPGSRQSQRRERVVVWLRQGSNKDDSPIWLRVPALLHRPLPEDALVKWAYLDAVRVGTLTKWSVRFAITRAEGFPSARPQARDGCVAINLGWRLLPGGCLRVAYAVGDDGQEEELRLPARKVSRWDHVEGLLSTRGHLFNAAKEMLGEFLASCPEVPVWLRERTRTLAQWHGPARLAVLLLGWYEEGEPVPGWRERRFDGDTEILATLEAWRAQDKHLYDWTMAERRRAQRWRTTTYRCWLAGLRQRYGKVRLHADNWRDLAALPDVAEDEGGAARVRYLQRVAAPGLLGQLAQEYWREATQTVAGTITTLCHGCGSAENFDRARELSHTCSICGQAWDQDRNACLNLLH